VIVPACTLIVISHYFPLPIGRYFIHLLVESHKENILSFVDISMTIFFGHYNMIRIAGSYDNMLYIPR